MKTNLVKYLKNCCKIVTSLPSIIIWFVVFFGNISHSLCHDILKHVLHILLGSSKHGKLVKTGIQYPFDLLLGALDTLCHFCLDIFSTLHLISFNPNHCGVFNMFHHFKIRNCLLPPALSSGDISYSQIKEKA